MTNDPINKAFKMPYVPVVWQRKKRDGDPFEIKDVMPDPGITPGSKTDLALRKARGEDISAFLPKTERQPASLHGVEVRAEKVRIGNPHGRNVADETIALLRQIAEFCNESIDGTRTFAEIKSHFAINNNRGLYITRTGVERGYLERAGRGVYRACKD